MRWRLLVPLLIAGCYACLPAPLRFRPGIDDSRMVRFQPPKVYERWWEEMEECSGRRGRLSAWRWQIYSEDRLRTIDDSLAVYGETRLLVRSVTFSRRAFLEEKYVKHEMLHALGVWSHDYRVFVTKCKVESDRTIRWQADPTNIPTK